MKVGSLCSGIDGLALGVEHALGARTVWQSEVDPHASTVLAVRWPGVPNLGDLRTVDWPAVEPVDVLCAGFPCQPVSTAGRRLGVEDERWLFDGITSSLGRMDPPPRLLLLENVAGLLTANGGGAMARVVHGLAALGYVGRWRLLRSSDVGAPHRRERVFVAAAHADRIRDWQLAGGPSGAQEPTGRGQADDGHGAVAGRAVAPDAAGERGRPGLRQERAGEGRPARLGLIEPSRGGAAPADTYVPGREGRRPAVTGGRCEPADGPAADADGSPGSPGDAQPGDGAAPHVRGGPPRLGGRCGPVADSHGERRPGRSEPDSAPTDPAQGKHQLEGLDPDGRVRWGAYEPAIRRWEAIHGPAPRPRDDRGRLNPELPEWMMGFRRGWVTDLALGLPRTAQLRLVGNAVQPQVAELAARLLLAPLMTAEAAA